MFRQRGNNECLPLLSVFFCFFLFSCLLVYFGLFSDKVSLCSPGWLQISYSPAAASWELGLPAYTTVPPYLLLLLQIRESIEHVERDKQACLDTDARNCGYLATSDKDGNLTLLPEKPESNFSQVAEWSILWTPHIIWRYSSIISGGQGMLFETKSSLWFLREGKPDPYRYWHRSLHLSYRRSHTWPLRGLLEHRKWSLVCHLEGFPVKPISWTVLHSSTCLVLVQRSGIIV